MAPPSGHDASLELFRRQLPPRLAKVVDLTGEARAAWLIGAHGFQTLAESGIGVPEASGRVASVGGEVSPVALALAPEAAPFVALAIGAEPAVAALSSRLVSAGALPGDERDLHAARILCGWPTLGAEIDERTLPRRFVTIRSAASPTPRAATPARRPSPDCIFGDTPIASCVACVGAERGRWPGAASTRENGRWGVCDPP